MKSHFAILITTVILLCSFSSTTARRVYFPYPRTGYYDPRVIGGQTIGEAAILHLLHIKDTSKDIIVCGASLVDVYGIQIAITAAHCLWEGNFDSLTPAQYLVLTAGDRKLSVRDSREQTRRVTKVVAYPGYDDHVLSHDMAIMFLSSDFEETAWVEPTLLPGYNWDEPKKVEVGGWGSLVYEGQLQDELSWVELPIVKYKTCQYFNRFLLTDITSNQMCVGELGAAKGTCSGDSGGPAVAYNQTAGYFYLAGIVSFGINVECGSPRFPVIYTRVSKYVDWIRIEVSQYKEEMGI